jgi:predicted house-cleaning noncanonical NTP pyrophosphatase (MazG superfamily)
MKLDAVEARILKSILDRGNYLHTKESEDAPYLELYQKRLIQEILESVLQNHEVKP